MPQTDWTGFEPELAKVWHYHHIFSAPFYYIEYGLSWLGALQVWQNSLQDPVDALAKYRAALDLGNSKSVPELFAAAGARFAFDRLDDPQIDAILTGAISADFELKKELCHQITKMVSRRSRGFG